MSMNHDEGSSGKTTTTLIPGYPGITRCGRYPRITFFEKVILGYPGISNSRNSRMGYPGISLHGITRYLTGYPGISLRNFSGYPGISLFEPV